MKKRLVGWMYAGYFGLVLWILGKSKEYILVDIDNTVNHQALRLSRFVANGRCDYRRANRFGQLIRDIPVDGASASVASLSRRFPMIWFTSRSLGQMLGTYVWLSKNGFAFHLAAFTGTTERKVKFLESFRKRHRIRFIVDDMKDGYEFDAPHYVSVYKEYVDENQIKVIEALSLVDE